MKGPFEENIEQQLKQFSLPPSPQIWQGIEKALHPHRKDMGLIWWWVPLLGLLLAGGGWWAWYHLYDQPALPKTSTVSSISRSNAVPRVTLPEHTTAGGDKSSNSEDRSILPPPEQKGSYQHNPLPAILKLSNTHHNIENKKSVHPDAVYTTKNATPDTMLFPDNEAGSQPDNDRTTNLKDTLKNKNALVVKDKQDQFGQSEYTSQTNKTTGNKTRHQDTLTAEKMVSLKKTGISGIWLGTVGTGILQSYNSFPVVTAQQSKTGVSLEAGINYRLLFNSQWMLETGLLYHYLQNKQVTGYDSVNYKFMQETNHASMLYIPVESGYTINPHASSKVHILLGGSAAWIFSEQWATTVKKYTTAPTTSFTGAGGPTVSAPAVQGSNNHLLAGIHAGIMYQLHDQFEISLESERTMTAFQKNAISRYYWQQWYLQISKPLNSFFRKSKPAKQQ